jgi:DNA-binding IclR family transcriptional regulator
MTRLRDQTTETVQLAVLDDFDVLYIGKVDGEHMLRLESAVGRRLEPHASGVGKVLLAALGDDELCAWMAERPPQRFTATTITDPEALLAELRTVRATGYATDREERTLGASCVAVGIRDHADTLVAAMSVSAPAVRFGPRQQQAALIHLRQAASDLSAALGHGTVTVSAPVPHGPFNGRNGPRPQRAHAPHAGRTR